MDIRIMFSCNDPDTGNAQGFVESVEFSLENDMFINLDGYRTTFRRVDKDHIRVGRRVYPILGYGTWIGNWCWDGVRVELTVANQIAEYLRSKREYHPTHATSDLWDAWEAEQPIDFAAFEVTA